MAKEKSIPTPLDIKLHQKSRVLEITFDDGAHFNLPCAFLRVFSPAAEVRVGVARGELITGKEEVNITAITPVGNYAVQLHFDDGHDTGVYSWKTLYELGEHHEEYWTEYLQRVQEMTVQGQPVTEQADTDRAVKLRILYFAELAEFLRRESEDVAVPSDVADVRRLLDWLAKRGEVWRRALSENALKITVNKQFATFESSISDGDEIALVRSRPE